MINNNPGFSNERRKYSRKEISTNLSYKVITPLYGKGTIRNISEGGLCIVLDKEMSAGTMLELKFELPGDKPVPIETIAKVMWQKRIESGFLTGIKFGT